ncbi:hypothetical protein DE146DRAFT_151524 [Phaeosphaeria sp. MPI-PUGE-AT-0046c]|nr:hypothetical protein DE146DRAFT_151524 [Phaeosphaeria sp. MPI-PUGE-AT-0046c]
MQQRTPYSPNEALALGESSSQCHRAAHLPTPALVKCEQPVTPLQRLASVDGGVSPHRPWRRGCCCAERLHLERSTQLSSVLETAGGNRKRMFRFAAAIVSPKEAHRRLPVALCDSDQVSDLVASRDNMMRHRTTSQHKTGFHSLALQMAGALFVVRIHAINRALNHRFSHFALSQFACCTIAESAARSFCCFQHAANTGPCMIAGAVTIRIGTRGRFRMRMTLHVTQERAYSMSLRDDDR